MNAIRVLLADDHAMVRAGLRALLEAAGDMLVIGEAENGHQAVREAERLRPQVVVLDLAMPLLNGIEAARQIACKMPAIRVLILSSYSDAHHLRQAVAAGVAGYLTKESAANDLLEAIRETCHGGAFFSPCLLHRLSEGKRAAPQSDGGAAPRPATLTRREAEVLQLLAEGYANKQTAGLLSLSIKTVEKHRQALMEKLNLHRTASLTRYAVSSGVVEAIGFPSREGVPGAKARTRGNGRAVQLKPPGAGPEGGLGPVFPAI
jgi:DNA-binding NarL/FixJ family response regulator